MRILLVVLVGLMTSACTAMMVGGGTAGDYRAGEDQRPASVVAADSAITTTIRSRHAADPLVSAFNVGVRTYDGTVTLTGVVASTAVRSLAESIARGTKGVEAVNNLVRVQSGSNAD